MKNKFIAVSALTAFTAVSASFAGSMGPVATLPTFIPFLGGEASYTGQQLSTPSVNGSTATTSGQGWGGRLSGGFVHPFADKWGFVSEIGGGYYGGKDMTFFTPAGAQIGTLKTSVDGYDVLVGGLYKLDKFDYWDVAGQLDLLVQGGFMVENFRQQAVINQPNVSPALVGTTNIKGNTTQAFPEIRVGGIYNLNDNWGLTVTYLHVWGSSPRSASNLSISAPTAPTTLTPTPPPVTITNNVAANSQAPTLDTVLFGLRYNIG